MTIRVSIMISAISALTACVAPKQALDGMWNAASQPVPGSGHVLTLTQQGTAITGTGTYTAELGSGVGTLTVQGTYVAPRVVLTFRYDNGTASTYTGILQDAAHIAGTESFSTGQAYGLTFVRE